MKYNFKKVQLLTSLSIMLLSLIALKTFAIEGGSITILESKCSEIMNIRDYREIISIVKEWRSEFSFEQIQDISFILLEKIASKKILKGENEIIKKMSETVGHDVFLEGGRAAWTIEQLLGITIPPVTKDLTVSTLEEIKIRVGTKIQYREIIDKVNKNLVLLESLSLEEKLILAEAYDVDKSILAMLTKDPNVSIRRRVASNLQVPIQDVLRLAKEDEDPEVRAKALDNLQHVRSPF
jgi:hypothetical protein